MASPVLEPGGGRRAWGSDVMVDAIKDRDLKYLAMNPGASYRGLHDSLVNYGGNSPALIECTHEKIAVQIAQGYAKASGEAMGCILHDTVGLLHGTMGIYCAYIDRVPMMIFGGTGPMAYERRRPNIDWIHTTNINGNAIREYVKWDEQPYSLESIHGAVARGYRVALSQPQGPVYVAFDAGLQEDELTEDIPPPDVSRYQPPTPIGPDPAALDELARMLVEAKRPVIIPGYAGRDEHAISQLVELAELVGVGVNETYIRLNFPTNHPLNVTGSDTVEEADFVLFVDVKDQGKPTQRLEKIKRRVESRISPEATIADLGFAELEISSWSHDFAAPHPIDFQVTADTAVALPMLIERCKALIDSSSEQAREQRKRDLAKIHERTRKGWRDEAATTADESPVSTAQLVSRVREVIKEYDFVLTAGSVHGWAPKLWDMDKPRQYLGESLGTGTQFGISLGAALAHKDTGKLVVDMQPDGDLLYDVGAMWTAMYHELPLLVVMHNNRAYYNDWEHQERMAKLRGTPIANAYYGMELDDPAPDFAATAKSFGWYAEGPIEQPGDVTDAVRRGAEHVMGTGKPALVDVVCQYR